MAIQEHNYRKAIYVLLHLALAATICNASSNLVSYLDVDESKSHAFEHTDHRIQRRDVPQDEVCRQQSTFLTQLKDRTVDRWHTFLNESKYAMALAWAGKNDGTLIIVTSETDIFGRTTSATLYQSNDFGANFKDVTKEKNIDKIIKKHNGIQRNPFDPKKVYLMGDGPWIYITENGGDNYTFYNMPFTIEEEIVFHPDSSYDGYLLARSATKTLYASFDNGKSWTEAQSNVQLVYWGVPEEPHGVDNPKTIYATVSTNQLDPIFHQAFFNVDPYKLMKSDDGGKSWTVIHDGVTSFERRGQFLYASVLKDVKEVTSNRFLKFSLDGGKSWREAKVPTIEPDQFYIVMDIEEDMVFLHVDDEDDTGHGTLYTSAADGIIYSESLQRHLYPNFGTVHDFYKVKSMRGVYITSQMGDDDSIHSMITFNRGAEWSKVPRPKNAPCKDETKECYLQIHGMYSLKRDLNILPPLSEETATGIILVHGHVAESLQKTEPDVYVTSDGGYTWTLSLQGPHHYAIGDHGGLLVAVAKSQSDPNPKIVKFSTDEGRCWHEYTFTNKTLNFTGLLTEPEGASAVVMLWGYVAETKKWEVHVIDFKDVIGRQCGGEDYEIWLEHAVYNSDKSPDASGCLLGQKRTFMRLKKDAWCYNGYDKENLTSTETCKCTMDDYECDYGYFRPGGSEKCVKIPEFKGEYIELCLRGHQEKEISEGYRKIPGDKCQGGYSPDSKKILLYNDCDESSKSDVMFDEYVETKSASGISKGAKILALIVVGMILVLAAIMSVYFIKKFLLLRRHKVHYTYSLLNQGQEEGQQDDWDHNLDSALSSPTHAFQDSEDEELSTKVLPPGRRPAATQNGSVQQKDTNPFTSYHDDSDDDLLS